MKTIKLQKVSKYYQDGDQVSVGMKNVSLSFNIGEFVAITGESGSGKTTLLNVISGLDKYEDGEMYIFGEESSHFQMHDLEKYRREYIGFVFQNYNIIDSYTVYQNVILALELQEYPYKLRKKRALEIIKEVGLFQQRNQKASKLSGGQKQRTVIARALAKDTPILVADEPTGNLDQESARQIMELLNKVSEKKLVVVVTHEYDQVKDYVSRRIKMSDGEVIDDKVIKKNEIISKKPLVKDTKSSVLQIFLFALRNLFSQPKRLFFMLILMTACVAVFTVNYSNQVFRIREIGLEQSRIFPSTPYTRILIEKRDGSSMTSSDIDYISSFSGVKDVYSSGYLFLNESRLRLQKKIESDENNNNTDIYWYDTYFDYTDSAVILKNSDLSEGRLPQDKYEIVVSPNMWEEIEVGARYYLFNDEYYESDSDLSYGLFTVVGVTKENISTLYLSEEYLSQPYPVEKIELIDLKINLINSISNSLTTLFDGNSISIYRNYGSSETDLFFDEIFSNQIQSASFTFIGTTPSGTNVVITINDIEYALPIGSSLYYAYVSDDLFNQIINEMMKLVESEYMGYPSKISSVSIENRFSGTNLIENINSDIYKVYYPSNLSSPLQDFLVFILSVWAFIIILLLGLLLYSVIHAVTKNMMKSRIKDFSIFRSVGAHKKTLAILVIIEQVILSMMGLFFALIIFQIIINTTDDHGLTIEYMRFYDYLILISSIILLGCWLGVRYNKKVFDLTVIQALSNGGDNLW